MKKKKDALTQVSALNLENYERHIIFCAGPSCFDLNEGEKLWEQLKNDLVNRGVAESGSRGVCLRTRAKCLRVCDEGPIAVVYPEGVWYRNLTRDNLSRVIDEHLIQGRVVADFLLCQNKKLGLDADGKTSSPD